MERWLRGLVFLSGLSGRASGFLCCVCSGGGGMSGVLSHMRCLASYFILSMVIIIFFPSVPFVLFLERNTCFITF